jgi:P-loop Domain of unknown function (DUF2791)
VIDIDTYVRFLGAEYLRGYIDAGGAAVKFAVAPDDPVASSLMAQVAELAHQAGYAVATVDAGSTRVHLLEQVFFEVARQIDWDGLAATTARAAVATAGYPAPAGGDVSLERLAAHHRVDARELKRDVDRELQHRVHRDYAMVQEFRTAMLRLCQAQLRTGQVADAEHAAVLDWLKGDLRQISALKSALIFRRIGRHNARPLLFSLAHWLAVNDHAGLVLILDIRRFGLARRPSPGEREGHYYTKAALLDAYEVLRQLVDNTDELANCCVVVVTSPAFLADNGRGLDAYQALKLRIFGEVRDRRRDNPFSSLVRLGAA